MRHPMPCQLAGALLGALAVVSLQGCKRFDMGTTRAPASPFPTVYLEDSVLTSRVRVALIHSPVVNSTNIGVESHQGVVLLSGVTADPTQIDLAVFVAQNVPGVRAVDSFMFSADTPTRLAMNQGDIPNRDTASTSATSHALRAGAKHAAQQSARKEASPSALASPPSPPLGHPLGLEDEPPADNAPRQSRWVSLAHRVLGIHSIQEELLIKQ